MTETELPRYRLLQLGAPNRNGAQRNEAFESLDDLVTHHPFANRHAHLVDGAPQRVESPTRRSYGVVGGEIQELETARTDEYRVLTESQVLLVKDFILEDSRLASGAAGVRDVDVPSPLAGYIGRVDAANGVVDILDRKGGEVIARARHLKPIAVQEDDSIAYGQSLGTQHRQGLPATAGKHVHFEIDTRYYQQYENYVADLNSGRLAIDAGRRSQGIEPQAVIDDGVIRVGESSERVRDVQRHLNDLGIRDANGQALPADGIYRLSMQAAVIRFQQGQQLPVTGDLDAATLRAVPRVERREIDRADYVEPGVRPLGAVPEGGPHSTRTGLEDPLHMQAKAAVHALDQSMGRAPDEVSDRMTASLALLAKQNGLSRIDRVMLSTDSEHARAGENVFVVQGDPGDPAKRLAYMKTQDAVGIPVERSIAQFHELEQRQPAQSVHAANEQAAEMAGPKLRA